MKLKTIKQINETKSQFFEKISKIDKALPRLTKNKKKKKNDHSKVCYRSYRHSS